MKIAIITHYWKNSGGGGVRTYVVNVVEALRGKGGDVRVLFRDGDDLQEYHAKKGKISFALDCYRQLGKIRPDVIHSQNTWYCLLPGIMYKIFHGGRLVHTFLTEPDRKLPLPAKLFYQFLLDRCDWVVIGSKRLEERIIEVDGFSFPRTAIIFGGARAGVVTPDELRQFIERFQLDNASPIILVQAFTQTSLKAQGLKLVIQSLKLIVNKYPRAVLMATRNGDFTEELKRFAENEGVGNHVLFIGDVNNPFVPLSVCDVFIFPWLGKTGVGMALLEAMVWGKPVITTDMGYGSEVVKDGENGLLVPPDASQIAEKVDLLWRDRALGQELGKNAKRTVEEGFTWERAAERYLRCYSSNEDPEAR